MFGLNRSGGVLGSGVLYVVYFLMMGIIFAGIVGGIFAFYGKGYDFRKSESVLLLDAVKKCFYENDVSSSVFEDNNLFFDKCGFSRDVLEDGEHLVFVNNSLGKEFFAGVYDYKIRCGFDARKTNLALPECSSFCKEDFCFLVASSQNSRRLAV